MKNAGSASSLGSTNGRTPAESAAQSPPRKPRLLAELPAGWPASGRIEFVRFIRSDRKLRILGRAIPMPETTVYEYVIAVLDLALEPSEGNLHVLRAGEIVATAGIKIGGSSPIAAKTGVAPSPG